MKAISMSNYFFKFESMDIEIKKKLVTMEVNTESLFAELIRKVRDEGLSEKSISKILEMFNDLKTSFEQQNGEYSLNHSIRIASMWWDLSEEKSYETLALCLGHNLREAGGEKLKNIEVKYLNAYSQKCLKRLTIDRKRERNSEYLAEYYNNIEEMGDELVLLKGCDKLDNFLSYPLYDLDLYYFMVVDQFVVPRLSKRMRSLSDYLKNVSMYVKTDTAKNHYR